MSTQLSRSFRLVCAPEQIPQVESLLSAQGFVFEDEPFFPFSRKLLRGPFPLGSSLAARFGYIYIQDRSSMLPPLALAPEPGGAALDMCASPGSKTGLLAGLVGKSGFVLGNEPSRKRLGTLRMNLRQQDLLCCSTCSYPGEELPLPDADNSAGTYPGWQWIQLDPPCSGWGTVEKNPQVTRLWQGDKVKPLIALQRQLLREAFRLLRPGGMLAYSTCTTNVDENEEQLNFALGEFDLELCPLADVPGFRFAEALLPGVWRVEPGEDGQGFFVALLKKKGTPGIKSGYAGREIEYPPEWRLLPQDALDSACVDSRLLPEGGIADFNGVLHFIPRAAMKLLPAPFVWKGFPLGRVDRSGRVRPDPYLRSLMPPPEQVRGAGGVSINLEEIETLTGLVCGQSLAVDAKSAEAALYFRDLPLVRLTIKGRRAVLPPF